jgi:hypothetical protein
MFKEQFFQDSAIFAHGETDNHQVIWTIPLIELIERRAVSAARWTPRSPEVEQYRLPF